MAIVPDDRVESPNTTKPLQTGQDRFLKFYLYKMTVDDGGRSLRARRDAHACHLQASDKEGGAGGQRHHRVRSDYYIETEYADRPDCIDDRTGQRFARKANAIFHPRVTTLSTTLDRRRVRAISVV